MTAAQVSGLRAALQVGYHLLDRGSSVLTAMKQTIRVLERSGLLNAGKGSHLQLNGVRRMDALIMEGHDLRARAVDSAEVIVHPITVARLVWNTQVMSFSLEPRPRLLPDTSSWNVNRGGLASDPRALPACPEHCPARRSSFIAT